MHHNRTLYLYVVAKRLEYFMGTKGDSRQSGNPPAFALHYATRTVVFADVVESVRLIQRDEFTAAQRIRALLLEAANDIVPGNRGHLLQRLGDGEAVASLARRRPTARKD